MANETVKKTVAKKAAPTKVAVAKEETQTIIRKDVHINKEVSKESVHLDTLRFMTELNQDKAAIAAKLAKVKFAVRESGGLNKDATGRAGAGHYNYATGDAVYKLLTPLLEKEGILTHYSLIPNTRKIRPYKNHNGNDQFDWLQEMHFQFIDIETGQMMQGFWEIAGTQKGDVAKTFGTALTYSIRYFLLKYFDIPTDKDDSDAIVETKEVKKGVSGQAKSLPKPKAEAVKPVAKKVEAPVVTDEQKAAHDIFNTYVKTQTQTAKFKKSVKEVVTNVTGTFSKASITTVAQANEIVGKLEEANNA